MRARNPRAMPTIEVSRTLVKSPPELWSELRGDRLTEAVGGATLKVTEDERRLEWESERANGSAVLEPAGWGTKLTLTAEVQGEVARLEPAVARLGLWRRLVIGPATPPDPGPEPERAAGSAELRDALEQLLDDLGSAHRRPFQAG